MAVWGSLCVFPTFVLAVDTTKDCHLSYKPISRKAALCDLDYVQLCCALEILPPPPPVPEDWESIRYARHTVKQGPAPIPSVTQEPVSPNESPQTSAPPPVANSSPAPGPILKPDLSKIKLLSTMSREDILKHMHHPNTTLPEIRPCDTRQAETRRHITRLKRFTVPQAVQNSRTTSN